MMGLTFAFVVSLKALSKSSLLFSINVPQLIKFKIQHHCYDDDNLRDTEFQITHVAPPLTP